jgi:amicyanin
VRPALLLGLLLAPVFGFLAPAQAATQHVMIAQYAFSAATTTVHVGDSVTWTNHDQAAHDVATTSGPASFHSPLLNTNQSWTFTFTAAGSYSYYCSVHPDMRATVVVLAADLLPPAAQHPAPAQQQPPARRPATTQTQTTQAAQPHPATPGAQPVSSAVAPPGEPAQTQAAAVVVGQRLDPMLIVAGIVAAVAVLCLLLISTRPEP